MVIDYLLNGCLTPGIHQISWPDFVSEFGQTPHRLELLKGLELGVTRLRSCGCKAIYVDGSFVTRKWTPNDFDVCWDPVGVDLPKLITAHPEFFNFDNGREVQKKIYKGEFFPANLPAQIFPRITYLQFFQLDKNGDPKGIVQLI